MRSLEERQKERKLRNQTQVQARKGPPTESRSRYDMTDVEIDALNIGELHNWAKANNLSIPKEISAKGKDAVADYIINAKKVKDSAQPGAKVEGWNANN